MRTFLVFNEISAEMIKELSNIKLEGVVSIHTPAKLENILSNFNDGDTLIIEGINLFCGVYELHSALSLISSISSGHFISLQQSLLNFKGHINKDILEVIGIGASLEERYLRQAEKEEDNQVKVDSTMRELKQLCIRILEDSFKNERINN